MKKTKSKKAQAEAINDIPAFFIIAVILILVIVAGIALPKIGLSITKDKQKYSFMSYQVETMAYSLLRQKQTVNIILADKIRTDNEEEKQKIEQQMNIVCQESDGECYFYFYPLNTLENCQNLAKGFCIFIPAQDKSALKFVVNKESLGQTAV